jgi:hypothetical protein
MKVKDLNRMAIPEKKSHIYLWERLGDFKNIANKNGVDFAIVKSRA